MLARQIRRGDVLFVGDVPHAVVDASWLAVEDEVMLMLDDGTTMGPLQLDDPLDVVRPFDRHAQAGDHDT